MPDLLLYADTERNPALRHEIPISIGDPFLYAEVAGRRYAVTWIGERDRIAATSPDIQLIDVDELGFTELLKSGMTRDELWLELTSRGAKQIGVHDAMVDFEFPLGLAA